MPRARTASKSKSSTSHSRTRKTSTKRTNSRPTTHRKTSTRTTGEEATYVYECTRPGCGYRIVRDEKMEQGQTRSDLKCPKCHHQEFRCLGKGDIVDTFSLPVPAPQPDLETFKTIGLGSN